MIEGRDIRYAMVGGGVGSFIGPVHRAALQMISPGIRLVSACFGNIQKIADDTAKEVRLDPKRSYLDFQEMAEMEAKLPENERPQFVVIATPNHLHFPVAKAFMEKGFSVFCEKPVTKTVQEAETLLRISEEKNLLFGVMYGYTGYPMIKEARNLIQSGKIGTIRKAYVEYTQGWLTDPIEKEGQAQAKWRTNPKESGSSLCMGDIGSHAENLLSTLTGLSITEVNAELSSFVPGRVLDDDGMVLFKLSNGANGSLFASQVLCGERNGLKIRVYGDQGGIKWEAENPERLVWLRKDGTESILHKGTPAVSSAEAAAITNLPSGHPEGVFEAFSNHYRGFLRCLMDRNYSEIQFPTLKDGLRGMQFIEAVCRSSESKQKWIPIKGD